MGGVWVVFESD